MKQGSTHRSLERGLAVLESVAAAGRPASLAETARRLGLHRSTAHHLMQTLVSAGYLQQEKTSRGYQLTAKLYQLTGRMWNAAQLGEIAQPILQELTRATGEATSVAAWIDGTVTIAAKCEAGGPVRVVQDSAADRPIYCTAVGKALAAWLPRAEVQAALARTRLVRLTPKTIVAPRAFEAELRRIRAAGYAVDDEEQYEGLRCIAMPVFCYTGQVFAAMCVLGPRHRMTQQKVVAVRAPLTALSRQLSARLGYRRQGSGEAAILSGAPN
jgi:DNA-binding IclR family transcriptional regulator